MAFKNYNYGAYKSEIKTLLRKRLNLLDKVRYHSKKAKEFSEQLPKIEKQLNDFLKKIGGK